DVALIGDVRITYSYPGYTGLPPRTVEGSTGDVAAVKGTRVHIETHPLRAARKALLLLGEAGEKGEVGAAVSGSVLTADLTLNEDASYRFWLQPPLGRAVREARSHHLTVEPDAPPRVEILGPADRLERQRDLLEKFIADLAQRLERGPGDDPAAALAGYVQGHDAEESHLALLGQLIDEDRRNGTLGKALRAALSGIADRLEHLLR